MTRTLKSGIPSEDDEQIALVQWIDRWRSQIPELEMFAAIPNGGKRSQRFDKTGARFSIEAARLKAMGVSPGYPDVLLDVPSGPFAGLRIELKSLEGSPSPEQRAWLTRLRARGYEAQWCRGWLNAARLIADYLRPRYVGTPAEVEYFPASSDTWTRFARSIPPT